MGISLRNSKVWECSFHDSYGLLRFACLVLGKKKYKIFPQTVVKNGDLESKIRKKKNTKKKTSKSYGLLPAERALDDNCQVLNPHPIAHLLITKHQPDKEIHINFHEISMTKFRSDRLVHDCLGCLGCQVAEIVFHRRGLCEIPPEIWGRFISLLYQGS